MLPTLEMLARYKCAEVEFGLKFDREKIGEGFVRLAPVLVIGRVGVDVHSE